MTRNDKILATMKWYLKETSCDMGEIANNTACQFATDYEDYMEILSMLLGALGAYQEV